MSILNVQSKFTLACNIKPPLSKSGCLCCNFPIYHLPLFFLNTLLLPPPPFPSPPSPSPKCMTLINEQPLTETDRMAGINNYLDAAICHLTQITETDKLAGISKCLNPRLSLAGRQTEGNIWRLRAISF